MMKSVLRLRIVLTSIFFLGQMFTSFAGFAGVYRCMDENGVVEFRDKACENTAQEQMFLPYIYERTEQAKHRNNGHTKKSVRAMANTWEGQSAKSNLANPSSKVQKILELEEQKRLRQETRLQKKSEKEALKKERRVLRCKSTEEKLRNIESQLRAGCKPKKCNRLKEQKAHFEIMKQRYCSGE